MRLGHVVLTVPVKFQDEVVAEHDVKLSAILGRHVNDNMISFYMITPSGFAMEYGTGGKKMNWEENVVYETTRGSDWGHKFM